MEKPGAPACLRPGPQSGGLDTSLRAHHGTLQEPCLTPATVPALEPGPVAPPGSGERFYRNLAWALVGALTLARIWLSSGFELQGDEAYFWLWSRHLDWCFFSKGPGIAVLIRLGTALCGDTTAGVRLFAVAASAGTSMGIYTLGRDLCSARAGFWAMAVANTTPLVCAGSLLATADMPSICIWTWSAIWFWRLRERDSPLAWAGLGALLGLGTQVRFVVAAEPLCFALYLGASPARRSRLRSPGFWVMNAALAASLAPLLIWQQRHGWITWDQLLARGALDRPWGLHPRALLEFLALQLALVLPYSAGALVAYGGRAARALGPEAWRYLAALSLPLFAFYTALALNRPGQPNWTGPAWIATDLLMVATFLDWGARSPRVRRLNAVAVLTGVAVAIAVHLSLWSRWLPAGRDPLARVRGGSDLALQVAAARRATGAAFLIGGHYQVASLLAFYLPDHPPVYTPCGLRPANQLDLWGGYGGALRGRDALFVASTPGLPPALTRQFMTVERLPPIAARWRGTTVRQYDLYLCRRLLQGCAVGSPGRPPTAPPPSSPSRP